MFCSLMALIAKIKGLFKQNKTLQHVPDGTAHWRYMQASKHYRCLENKPRVRKQSWLNGI